MKRGRPARAHLALARTPGHALHLEAPEIRRLSAEFRGLRDGLHAEALGSIRRLGEILEEGRRLLRKDLYEAWVGALCVSVATAKNYRGVFRLAKQDPPLFARCEELAADKVYRLATVPQAFRARVLDAMSEGRCASEMGVKERRSGHRERPTDGARRRRSLCDLHHRRLRTRV